MLDSEDIKIVNTAMHLLHPMYQSAWARIKEEIKEAGERPTSSSAVDAMPALCEQFILTAHFENSEKDILRSFVQWVQAQH